MVMDWRKLLPDGIRAGTLTYSEGRSLCRGETSIFRIRPGWFASKHDPLTYAPSAYPLLNGVDWPTHTTIGQLMLSVLEDEANWPVLIDLLLDDPKVGEGFRHLLLHCRNW